MLLFSSLTFNRANWLEKFRSLLPDATAVETRALESTLWLPTIVCGPGMLMLIRLLSVLMFVAAAYGATAKYVSASAAAPEKQASF